MQLGIGEVAIRLVSSLVILIVYLRISSVSLLASKTTSDEIGNIVMGALIGGTITVDVSYWIYIATLILWGSLQILLRAIKYRSEFVSDLIDGERIQLIKNGALLPKNFDKTQLTPEDFLMDLHQHEINSIDEVVNVWLEPSGELTIDKKDDVRLSTAIISNGSIVEDELLAIKKNREWLTNQLHACGYEKVKEIFLGEYHDGKLWLYPYSNKRAQ